MLTKIYTADVIKEGRVVGHIKVQAWFWQSTWRALEAMNAEADRHGFKLIQIRRVR